jgi:hypothetical protein
MFTTLMTLAVTLKQFNWDGAQHAAWMLAPVSLKSTTLAWSG